MRVLLLVGVLLLVSVAWGGLLAPGVGLRGAYFPNPALTGQPVSRYDATLDLAWTAEAAPIAGVPAGAFSTEWRGYLLPAFTESYTITITTGGGVRLMVNEKRIIDQWTPAESRALQGSVALQAGKLASIILRTTQPTGAGSIKLQWSSPSRPLEVIPATRLYPPLFAPMQLVYAETLDPRASLLNITELDGTPRPLTVAGSSQPVLTPDNRRVLFRTVANVTYGGSSILRVGLNGREQNALTRPGPGERLDPAISADGRTIAYVNSAPGSWEIWTMRSDGTNRKSAVKNAFENRHPALAPDGSYLVYQSKREAKWNLYKVTLETGEETPLTTDDGTEPAINRQGNAITFISARGGRPQLFQMKPDGSEQKLLVDLPGSAGQPFFFRGSKNLGFLLKDAKGKSDLYLMDMADLIPCQVTASGKVFSAALSELWYMAASESLMLWLNAQQASTLTIDDNGRVAVWTDASPRATPVAATALDTRPFYRPTSFNGGPALYWDGNCYFQVPDLSAGWGNAGGTMVLLFAPDNAADYNIIHQDNGGGGEHWRYGGDGNGYIGLFMAGRQEQYPQAMPTDGPSVLSIVSTPDQYTAYLNGTAQPARPTQFFTPTTLSIGAGGNGARYRGSIAQLAFFNRALTDEERIAVENYFKGLYGL